MSDPLISAVCVTYARVHLLEEAIHCFLQQTFTDSELVILNTFPDQELIWKGDGRVRVLNTLTRPSSLATARNMSIHHARGKYIVTWDDDCIYLPRHLGRFVQEISDGIDFVWSDRMFLLERGQITKLIQASENTLCFSKRAWEKSGKYLENFSVGEDRNFSGRITGNFRGIKQRTTSETATLLYGWDNGAYHISGHGFEASGAPAYEKVKLRVESEVANKRIPTGTIKLKAQSKRDYQTMALQFSKEQSDAITEDDICLVELGRMGDCINALPIAKEFYDASGRRPFWMIAREFASLLDGVSYVKPYPVDLTFHQLNEAMIIANERFNRVAKAQIYGHNHRQDTHTPSWPQESWRQCGMLHHYHDRNRRPVFDLRDKDREARLAAKVFRTTKPKIITNLTSAISVPFPAGPKILAAIQLEFGKQYEVVDIGKLRADRIYDLIGLYERAEVIVSIDTATMHLAAAVDVALVALVNPAGWLGPQLRFNCVDRIPYTEANVKRIIASIKRAPEFMRETMQTNRALRTIATPPKLSSNRLKLPSVTAWGCCWSDSKDMQLKTLRALRYCHSIIEFKEIVLLSFLPVPDTGFPLRIIQIPQLTAEGWNVFHAKTFPYLIDADYAMSIHWDGFPLNVDRWSPGFLDWDYLGAPWPDGVVGNGGFCLESRKMLEAKKRLPFSCKLDRPIGTVLGHLNVHPSDEFVGRVHRKTLEDQGIRFAPAWEAAQFSTEITHQQTQSFGWHGHVADPVKFKAGWDLIAQSEKEDLCTN